MGYSITTTDGRQCPALDNTYETIKEAEDALKSVMGWDTIVCDDFCDDGWAAVYKTRNDAENDAENDPHYGAYAPKIREVP